MNFEDVLERVDIWERVKAERRIVAYCGLTMATVNAAIDIAGNDYPKMDFLMNSKTEEGFAKYCGPNYKWCIDTYIKKNITINDELPIGTVLLYADGIEPVMIKVVGE